MNGESPGIAGRPKGDTVAHRQGLGAWLRLGLDSIAEKRFANRRSHELLELYQRARGRGSHAAGKELYATVVIQAGYDQKEAQRVLLRAEQSFCEWPVERELSLRDVVRYVVVTEYLRTHLESVGTHTNMGNVAARAIPENL